MAEGRKDGWAQAERIARTVGNVIAAGAVVGFGLYQLSQMARRAVYREVHSETEPLRDWLRDIETSRMDESADLSDVGQKLNGLQAHVQHLADRIEQAEQGLRMHRPDA